MANTDDDFLVSFNDMLDALGPPTTVSTVAVRDAVRDTLAIMERFKGGEDVPHEEVEAARLLWDEQIARVPVPAAAPMPALATLTAKERAARRLKRHGTTITQTKLRSFNNTTQRPRLALKPRKGAH